MNKWKNRSGFSVAEVIVAMAVVVVVGFTALSILLSSMANREKTVADTYAYSFAEDALTCFRACDGDEEFLAELSFAHGSTPTGGDLDENGYRNYIYICDTYGYVARMKVKYSESARSEFAITLTDKDGDALLAFDYRKGDGT